MFRRLGLPGVLGVTLGLALAIIAQGGRTAQAFDPATVQCYAPGRDPELVGSSASGSLEGAAQTALQAALRCRDSRCGEAPRRDLQSKVRIVLGHIRAKAAASRRADGAALAPMPVAATAAPQTAAIALPDSATELSRVLAALYEEGRLDIASYGPQRDVLSLLVLKPAALRPCAPPVSRPNVSRYVY